VEARLLEIRANQRRTETSTGNHQIASGVPSARDGVNDNPDLIVAIRVQMGDSGIPTPVEQLSKKESQTRPPNRLAALPGKTAKDPGGVAHGPRFFQGILEIVLRVGPKMRSRPPHARGWRSCDRTGHRLREFPQQHGVKAGLPVQRVAIAPSYGYRRNRKVWVSTRNAINAIYARNADHDPNGAIPPSATRDT
jgi:hypothetical protein